MPVLPSLCVLRVIHTKAARAATSQWCARRFHRRKMEWALRQRRLRSTALTRFQMARISHPISHSAYALRTHIGCRILHAVCCILHVACCMLRLGFRSLCRAAAVVHSGAHLDSVPEQPGPSCPPTHITRYYSTHGCSGRDGVWRHCKIRTLSAACPCYGDASGTVSLPCCTATESPNAPQVYDGSPSELKAFWRSSVSAPRRACPILPCPAAPVQYLL